MPVGTSGVCTCVPFEEGLLHLWIKWVGCPPVGLGVKRGVQKTARGGQPDGRQPDGLPNSQGEITFPK